jgi:hypothetical protein
MRTTTRGQSKWAQLPLHSFAPIRSGLLQCKSQARRSNSSAPPIVNEVLRSPGQPLDAATRSFMEPRFGHDFSHVQVHTGEKAAESARAVNALAYTVGSHVVFGAGQYSMTVGAGQALLAHELAHVFQQDRAAALEKPQTAQISPRDDIAEGEADLVASEVLSARGLRRSKGISPPSAQLQRQEEPRLTSSQPLASQVQDVSLYPYLDDFDSVYYDVDYRHEGGNLSKWLRVNYSDGTTIDVHMDSIVGESMTPESIQEARQKGHLGDGGRAFPNAINSSTTPRLWEAKRSAIEAMEQYNFEFMTAALPAVLFIITMPLTVMGMGPRSTAVRRGLTRGISALKPRNVFDDTLKAALKPNTLRHVFGKAQHGLDPLVKQLGSEEKVMTEVVKGLTKIKLPQAGLFEEPVLIAGRTVTVRGAVVDGIPRLSTMFIEP